MGSPCTKPEDGTSPVNTTSPGELDQFYHFPFIHGGFYTDAYAKSGVKYPPDEPEVEIEDSYSSYSSTESTSEEQVIDPLVLYARRFPELNRIDTVQEDGDNALLIAVRAKHHDAIIWLLDNGIPASYQNERTGNTAMHLAVMARDKEIVKIIKQFNNSIADTIKNKKRQTALKIAQEQHDIDMQILLAQEVDATASVLKKRRKRGKTKGTPKMGAQNSKSEGLAALGHTDTERSESRSKSKSMAREMSKSKSKKMLKQRKKKYNHMVNPSMDMHMDNTSNAALRKYLKTLYQDQYATFEQKEDAGEKLAMELNRDKANRTEQWKIGSATAKLPVLKDWLFEKQGRSWRRRYVVVSGSQMMWG